MNPQWITVALTTTSILITVGGFCVLYGKLTQKVEEHGGRLDKHDERFDKMGATVADHGERLSGLEEWRDGFRPYQPGRKSTFARKPSQF